MITKRRTKTASFNPMFLVALGLGIYWASVGLMSWYVFWFVFLTHFQLTFTWTRG